MDTKSRHSNIHRFIPYKYPITFGRSKHSSKFKISDNDRPISASKIILIALKLMESREGLENVVRWENMNRDILSNIFKKLDVVDVIMRASRVCINWFLASHDKTIWNTIKLNDLDSIFFDNSHRPHIQVKDREKQRYRIRMILVELNKFCRNVPENFFFNIHCNVLEEDLTIISKGMPNIRKLALPMWTNLDLISIQSVFFSKKNSVQLAFSKWKNLQTLIIAPHTSQDDFFSLDILKAIGDNCRNLTTMKFCNSLVIALAKIMVWNFPSLERLSFRGSVVCTEAAMTLIIGHPNLKILNLSHCIFSESDFYDGIMEPKEELVKTGTQKLENFMVCCPRDCTICKDVWEMRHIPFNKPEFRIFSETQWKTDEIKELQF